MKVFFVMLFSISAIWACNVESSFYQMDFDYPAMEVNLFEENKIDFQKARTEICEKGCEKNEESLLVYRSSLDTSLFVCLNDKQVKLFKMCYSVSDCARLKMEYNFTPIFSNVLSELKERKLFVNSFNVDSLAEHILSVMLLESRDNFSLWGEVYNYNDPELEDSIDIDAVDKVLTTGMICNDFCDYLDTLRQCPELITSISNFHFNDVIKIRKLTNGAYFIEGAHRNEPYRLYDVNGKILSQGTVGRESIRVNKIPVILEISNSFFLLN